MSRVRLASVEGLDGLDTRGPCVFCGEVVDFGVFWRGAEEIRLCDSCARSGELGKLLGDAARDCHDLGQMLDHTAREAWRALALAQERERK